ncbi:MAG TPA: VWA domain-containing protein [Acidimicrobiia bacterium]|nr:VWA domain-containing protein [Acidimicrobiia bacterium]
MDAAIKLDHSVLAVESEHTLHAMLELRAPEAPAGKRPALRLALVIDRSASMAGEKLDTVKRSATFLHDRMGSEDSLAVVAFDDEVRLVASLGPTRPEVRQALEQIEAGGTTNLSGGWFKGLEQLRRVSDGIRRVVLLTDGLANVGISDPERLAATARSAAELGVTTTTIGYGDGFQEELLTAMADAGRGRAYYAAGPDEAPGIFAKEFEGLASIQAQNLSVEIRPGPEVEGVSVLSDLPPIVVDGGIQIELGDIYGGELRRLVFRLHVPAIAELGPRVLGEAVIRWTSIGAKSVEMVQKTIPIGVNLVTSSEAGEVGPDLDVTEEVTVLSAVQARRVARDQADRGDIRGASAVLRESADQLLAMAPGSARAVELRDDAADLERSATAMAVSYDSAASKHLHYRARERERSMPTSRSQRGETRWGRVTPGAAESPTSRSYWVVDGRLLAGAYPSHVDADAGVRLLQQLIDAGVDAVVDLTQRHDPGSTDAHLRPYEDDLERLAPSSVLVRHPILDLNIPTEDEMVAALDTIDRLLDEGRVVYVHCWGGIGRTGTVVGSWLIRHGVVPAEWALDLLTELRSADRGAGHRRSPETGGQRDFVRRWELGR